MQFSLYGFLVGLGVFCVWNLFEYVLKKDSSAKNWPENVWLWGCVFSLFGALCGARAYHVLTDWHLYAEQPFPAILAVWNGGLGWFGGFLGGLIGLSLWKHWFLPAKTSWFVLLDALALSLPFGQAIGRWGNYFNQEIFGAPTMLPWGIFIPEQLRPEIWRDAAYFHPLFLYESLSLTLFGVGLWSILRKTSWLQVGSGNLFALYALFFGSIRFALDFLRIDLTHFSGLTMSQWFSLTLIMFGGIVLVSNVRISWLKKSFVAIFMLVVGHAFPTPALAQAPIDLSILPAVVEITIQPGKSVTRAFTLKNYGTTDLTTTFTLKDFVSDNQTGSPVLLDSSSFPYASFANSDRALNDSFLLPAGGEQQVVLSLNIPEDALQQDWYFVLLAQTEPVSQEDLTENRASSHGSIGATVLVRVSETEHRPLQWLVSFPTLPQFFDSLRPLQIEPLVENLNITVASPELTITVRNWRGNVVFTQEGLPERVLARSSRVIQAGTPSKKEANSLEATPFIFSPRFALGKYTVEGSITNQAGQPLIVQKTVWALPISGVIVVCLLILGLKIVPALFQKRRTQSSTTTELT